MTPKVSLIIATYNRHDLLGNTLALVLAQDYEDLEILVVDQTSVPFPPAAEFEGRSTSSHGLRYLWHPRPNLPAARNIGLRETDGEFVIFLDDDVLIEPDYVSAVISAYANDQIAGVCGVTVPEGCSNYEAQTIQYAEMLVLDEPLELGGLVSVKSLIGVNMSLRRSVFSAVGLFDEAFGGSGTGEESEFFMRAHRLGYRFALNPRIQVVHLASVRGGCRNRDVDRVARIASERLVLRLYIILKHAKWDLLDAARSYCGISRGHALNKVALRLGLRNVIRRQMEVISATWRIIAYLAGRRPELLQSDCVEPSRPVVKSRVK